MRNCASNAVSGSVAIYHPPDRVQDFVHASSSLEDVDLEQIASQAAGMLPSDLMAISADAASSAALQALGPELAAMLDGKEGSSEAHSQSEASAEGLRLTSEHYETGLQNLRQRTAVAIGAPQVRCCMADLDSFPGTPCFDALFAAPVHLCTFRLVSPSVRRELCL